MQQQPTKLEILKQRAIDMRRALATPNNRGMSLVEVLIVLTIMASIAGVVGVFALGALGQSQEREAKIEVGNLTSMVEQYMLMASPPKLPDNLEQLTEGRNPVTKKVPKDPWGNDYIYKKINNREFEIISAGADGAEGSEDDIKAD